MKYSVLMSVYYKEDSKCLKESLQSIFNQTLLTDDFVLVEDGLLTDDLYAVIDEFKSKYNEIFNVVKLDKNVGLGRALNEGLKKCKNNIVARMDSDDISLPDRCKLQMDVFLKNPEISIVSGTIYEFEKEQNNIISIKNMPVNDKDILNYAKKRSPFNHPCVMYKKDSVLAAGGYQHFLWFEDYYLWIRMLNNGCKGYNIQEPLLLMRSGNSLYERRGGLKYLKQMIKFRKYMYSIKFCSLFTFLYVTIGQSLVCILPNKMRVVIYKKLLRER